MKCNAGKIDRSLRITSGIALVAGTIMGVIPAWGWIGVIFIATGAIGYCPIYPLLRINTCKRSA